MAKFLNKKEQVIDFQLTPYGKRTLALGTFKPVYYSFFDEGIIYDGKYASLDNEKQNEIHERIKDDTTFLEGILSFVELENTVPPSMTLDWTSSGASLENSDVSRRHSLVHHKRRNDIRTSVRILHRFFGYSTD